MSLSKSRICHRLRLLWLFFIYLCCTGGLSAQQLSDQVKISLLTCGQGDELYSLFGHTAIRVADCEAGVDRVYNYGTFDPDQSFFYWRFLMGSLEYELSVTNFTAFYEEYTSENRSIYEQELNFPAGLPDRIYDSLEINALPENSAYRYDFFEDNCTTRSIGLIYNLAEDERFDDFFNHPTDLTYRKELRQYTQHRPWLQLGINLLLGRYSDTKISNLQSFFLPANLMSGLAKTDWAGEPSLLFEGKSQPVKAFGISNPMIVFWVLAAFFILEILLLKTNRRTSDWFDIFLFAATALPGIILLLVRLFSEHPALQSNINIIWANPLNLLFALFLFKNWSKAARIYSVFYAVLLSFMLVSLNKMPQQIPLEIMPVLFLLAFRTLQRIFLFVDKPEKVITQ